MALLGLTVNTSPGAEGHITPEADAAIYQGIFGEDAVLPVGEEFSAQIINNNCIRLGNGVLCVGGHMCMTSYGDYTDVIIDSAGTDMVRYDLICARFETTGPGGVDSVSIVVKKGTEVESSPKAPSWIRNNLYEGGLVREFPLHMVRISGPLIMSVSKVFNTLSAIPQSGIWTPTVDGLSMSAAYGDYVVLGQTVIISFYFTGVPTGVGGRLEIKGFPLEISTDYRWAAGGGHAQGFKHSGGQACFSGWNLQASSRSIFGRAYALNADGISGAGYLMVPSTSDVIPSEGIHASGTIMARVV